MTKVTSRLLTLLLAFAMVFTSLGWLGSFEANAAEGPDAIKIQAMNGSDPVENVGFVLKYQGEDDYLDVEIGKTDRSGLLEYEIYDTSEFSDDSYQLDLVDADKSNYSMTPVDVELGFNGSDNYVASVGTMNPYDGSAYVIELTPVGSDVPDPNALPAVEDFNSVDSSVWPLYGINYTDIDLTQDYIIDVRHTDSSVTASAGFVDFTKDPHFVNSNDQCVDVTGGVVAAGSAQAAKFDELYTKADGKRIVIICYGGMTMAKRAMQYFNTKEGVTLGPDGDVTYLIGGSNAVLAGEYKNNLGISNSDIDLSKDVILDVRGADDFNSGHLAGARGVDLRNNTAAAKSADLDSALAAVPADGKLVIICYQGKGLAYKAVEYYMANASKDDLKKVSYVIGGANTSENFGVFTGEEKARTMEVNIDMTKYPKGEVVRAWIPVPQSDELQTISNEEFWANKAKASGFKTFKSGEFTNKLLYVEWGADADPADRTACLKYDAKRVLVSNNGIIVATDDTAFPAEVQEYITKTSKYVQTDGIVAEKAAEITAGKTTTYDKARAIYEWVVGNLERIDNGETLECKAGSPETTHTFEVIGCGYGDTKTILNDLDTYGRAGGHCTDINSVFVALCRASGIPAREMFGIRMSDDATGGQHCWAEFYQPGAGWVFADPGDVCKFGIKNNKSNLNMTLAELEEARNSENTKQYTKAFWGGVDNNRVVLSRGRDLTLEPAQTGEAYNTFGYPCGEHNGQRIECTDAKNFVYTIASKPYGTAITPAPKSDAAPAPAVQDGQTAVVDGSTYKVTSASAKTAEYVKAPNKKSVTVPATVAVNGQTLAVTLIGPNAFTGKKIKTVTVGANVSKIAANAFKKSKATKMIVKSKKLTKASVKGSLKGSKIKTVQVKVGKKKENKKYVKKYKKFFTKKNAGKKAKVK